PDQLRARAVAFTDLLSAVRPALAAGASTDLASLGQLPVTTAEGGKSVRLDDLARVRITDDMPTGLADLGGFQAVGGIVIARRDADLGALVGEVKRTLDRQRA